MNQNRWELIFRKPYFHDNQFKNIQVFSHFSWLQNVYPFIEHIHIYFRESATYLLFDNRLSNFLRVFFLLGWKFSLFVKKLNWFCCIFNSKLNMHWIELKSRNQERLILSTVERVAWEKFSAWDISKFIRNCKGKFDNLHSVYPKP